MTILETFNGTNWIQLGATGPTGPIGPIGPIGPQGPAGPVTSVGISGSTGLSVSNSPITDSGIINLTLGEELQVLSAFAEAGLVVRTGSTAAAGSSTYVARTITGGSGISISNGNGVSGNPTISLANYPNLPYVYLRGDGNWVNLYFSFDIWGIQAYSDIYMRDLGFFLRGYADKNHGMIWDSNVEGPQFRGYHGFSWNIGNSGETMLMELDTNGLTLSNGTLIVNSSSNFISTAQFGYLNSSTPTGLANGYSAAFSIVCSARVSATEFNAVSSIKTKNIESSGEDIEEEALKIFSNIPFFKYSYKDKIKNGKGVTFGIVAEPLKEILPDYVLEDKTFVPNILQSCLIRPITEDSYQLVFKEKLTNIEGNKLQLILLNKSIEVEILKTTSKRLIISCSKKLPNNGFAYGTFESCPSVTKNKLFELSMVVLKNVLKRIEILEQRGNHV